MHTHTHSPASCSLLGRVNPEILNRSLTSWPLMFTSSCDCECRLGEILTSMIQGRRWRSNMTSNPNNSWTLYRLLTLALTWDTTAGSELWGWMQWQQVHTCTCIMDTTTGMLNRDYIINYIWLHTSLVISKTKLHVHNMSWTWEHSVCVCCVRRLFIPVS